MNILDENVPESQRSLLRKRRVPVRQVGQDTGRKGMKDNEIIPLLHQLDRPTFFTTIVASVMKDTAWSMSMSTRR